MQYAAVVFKIKRAKHFWTVIEPIINITKRYPANSQLLDIIKDFKTYIKSKGLGWGAADPLEGAMLVQLDPSTYVVTKRWI